MTTESKDLYYYQPAALNKLSSELAKAFESMEADGNRYIKSATINTLLVVNSNYDKKEIEDLIYSLTLVHPNRIFLIVLDETLKEIKSEFSTRCHKISKNEHICSEVIRLFTSNINLSGLKSVIRANLITGVSTELILYEGVNPLDVCNQFAALSEQIIFTSSIFKNKFSDLNKLLQFDSLLIDLDWVKLSLWREQVKDLFNNPAAKEKLSELKQIEISYSGDKIQALFLAGWLMDRLSLEIVSNSGSKLTLSSKDLENLTMEIHDKKSSSSDGVTQLNFFFENKSEYIKFARSEVLSSEINLKEHIRATRPAENLNFLELLKRYFFIGESIINYKDSLSKALKLDI